MLVEVSMGWDGVTVGVKGWVGGRTRQVWMLQMAQGVKGVPPLQTNWRSSLDTCSGVASPKKMCRKSFDERWRLTRSV